MSANMSVYKAMNNINSNNSSVNPITITDNKPSPSSTTSSSETGYSNAVRTRSPTSGIENELGNLSMSNKMSNEYNADLTTGYNVNARKMPVSELQEMCVDRKYALPQYQEIAYSGSAHSPIFTIQVTIQGVLVEKGVASTKKEAKHKAAANALRRLWGNVDQIHSDGNSQITIESTGGDLTSSQQQTTQLSSTYNQCVNNQMQCSSGHLLGPSKTPSSLPPSLNPNLNPISQLQELLAKKASALPVYDYSNHELHGVPHFRCYCKVNIDGHEIKTIGEGGSKNRSKHIAAEKALIEINELGLAVFGKPKVSSFQSTMTSQVSTTPCMYVSTSSNPDLLSNISPSNPIFLPSPDFLTSLADNEELKSFVDVETSAQAVLNLEIIARKLGLKHTYVPITRYDEGDRNQQQTNDDQAKSTIHACLLPIHQICKDEVPDQRHMLTAWGRSNQSMEHAKLIAAQKALLMIKINLVPASTIRN